MRSSVFEMLRFHLLCLVDAGDGRHLAVFVSPKYLAQGARGHPMGDAVYIDLFFFVDITHRDMFLSVFNWFATVEI